MNHMTEAQLRQSLVTPEAIRTLVTISNLLRKASREAWELSFKNVGDVEATMLAADADSVHGDALTLLLPLGADLGEDTERVPTGQNPQELVRRAEQLSRDHWIHEFPAGTSRVVIGLLDLKRNYCRE